MTLFSGIRPSGQLHLGNYLGAIKNWTQLQEKYDCIFTVVDYHAITTPFEKEKIGENTLSAAIEYLAAGINPEKAAVVVQSHLCGHAELAWILASITPLSWFEKIPTFKEKVAEKPEYVSAGLLSYPALMAADILLYKAKKVPVGKDQLPHIEIANNIAKRFNNMFGQTFPEVEALITEGAKIMSLQEPTKKMSKTGSNGILISDSPDTISKKIKSAVTDSGSEIKFDPENKPAISNLLVIFSQMSGRPVAEIEKEYQGKNYVQFKENLAETLIASLAPVREKIEALSRDKKYVLDLLKKNAEKISPLGEKTLREVKEKMGFLAA